MSPLENVFKGAVNQLTGVTIDAPLAQAKALTPEYYAGPYGNAATEAEEKGETQKAAIYRFLQVITSFHPSFDTPAQPFVPMWQAEDQRSLIPTDLTAQDIEVVRVLAGQTTDEALRARLHDLLWELK